MEAIDITKLSTSKGESANYYAYYANRMADFFIQLGEEKRDGNTDNMVLNLLSYIITHYETFKNELNLDEQKKIVFSICRSVVYLTNSILNKKDSLVDKYTIKTDGFIGNNIFGDLKFLQKIFVYQNPYATPKDEETSGVLKDIANVLKSIINLELDPNISAEDKAKQQSSYADITVYPNIFSTAAHYREQQRFEKSITDLNSAIKGLENGKISKAGLFLVFSALGTVGELCTQKNLTVKTKLDNPQVTQKLNLIKRLTNIIVKPENYCNETNIETLLKAADFSEIKKELELLRDSLINILHASQQQMDTYDKIVTYYTNPTQLISPNDITINIPTIEAIFNLMKTFKSSGKLDKAEILSIMQVMIGELKDLIPQGIEILEDDSPLKFPCTIEAKSVYSPRQGDIDFLEITPIDNRSIKINIPSGKIQEVRNAVQSIDDYNHNSGGTGINIPKKFFGLGKEYIQSTPINLQIFSETLAKQNEEFINFFINFGKHVQLMSYIRFPENLLISEFYLQTTYRFLDTLKESDSSISAMPEYRVLRNAIRHFEDNLDVLAVAVQTEQIYAHYIVKYLADMSNVLIKNGITVYLVTDIQYDNPILNHPELMKTFADKFGVKALDTLIILGMNFIGQSEFNEMCSNNENVELLAEMIGYSE